MNKISKFLSDNLLYVVIGAVAVILMVCGVLVFINVTKGTTPSADKSKISRQILVDGDSLIVGLKDYTITKRGDNLWDVSKKFYRNPILYPFIFGMNTNVIKDVDIVGMYQTIKIPMFCTDFNTCSMENVPLQVREKLSKSYLELYNIDKTGNWDRAKWELWFAHQLSPDYVNSNVKYTEREKKFIEINEDFEKNHPSKMFK